MGFISYFTIDAHDTHQLHRTASRAPTSNTTIWTAIVYNHFGISLEYINLQYCQRLQIVLLRRYRCLRRSRMISKVSRYNIINKSKSTNRRIVSWQLRSSITRNHYIPIVVTVYLYIAGHAREMCIQELRTLRICYYSSNIGYCVLLRGGVIRGGIVLYTIVL